MHEIGGFPSTLPLPPGRFHLRGRGQARAAAISSMRAVRDVQTPSYRRQHSMLISIWQKSP